LKEKRELDGKLSAIKTVNSCDSPPIKITKNGDRIDTQASNDDDHNKRFEDHFGEAESESDQEVLFEDPENFTITVRNRETSENLFDLMGCSRNSYHGDLVLEEAHDLLMKSGNSNPPTDFTRLVDQEIQTETNYNNNNDFKLKTIEEEKYNTSLQDSDYSINLDLGGINRENDSCISRLNSPRGRKDALEEYFRMTVLAMKVAHHDLDKVCHVKSSYLYQKAKTKSISFHEWQPWIEQQLNQMYLDAVYKSQGERRSLDRAQSLDEKYEVERRPNNKSGKEQLRDFINREHKGKNKKGYMSLEDENDQKKQK